METVKATNNSGPKETKKEPKWKDIRKAFYEAGPHIKDRMLRGKRATKKAKKREECLLTQAGKLKCQHKVDKLTRLDLVDNLREFKKR